MTEGNEDGRSTTGERVCLPNRHEDYGLKPGVYVLAARHREAVEDAGDPTRIVGWHVSYSLENERGDRLDEPVSEDYILASKRAMAQCAQLPRAGR